VNEATKNITMNKYPVSFKNKAFVIPHSFDERSYQVKLKRNEKLVMRYIGDFYGKRTPESIFNALNIVKRKIPEFNKKFELEIYGSPHHMLDQLIQSYDLGDIVKYKGLVSYVDSLKLMKSADVLLVIDAPAKENLFLTSKIIDYVGANVTIFAVTPKSGPTAELIDEIGWRSFEHEDITGMSIQIIEYLELKKNKRLSGNINKTIYDRFRIETVGQQYLDIIKALS
jgi:glycosyltransferase involved in cell wall biosynthesis